MLLVVPTRLGMQALDPMRLHSAVQLKGTGHGLPLIMQDGDGALARPSGALGTYAAVPVLLIIE
jgi:hypothetical protein